MDGIATQADVEARDALWPPADLAASTYEIFRRSAKEWPEERALSFFLTVEEHRDPETWTYAELFAEITRTANAFHAVGARKDTVIAYVLPNLPETHFVLWGGQAAGVVLALNPLLEAPTLGQLLRAANAEIVVTLAPFPRTDLFAKVARALGLAPSVKDLFVVDLADRARGPKKVLAKIAAKVTARKEHGLRGMRGAIPAGVRLHKFRRAQRSRSSDHLDSGRVISSSDRSSLFCTGGTTGLPKIAVRNHGNEVANAWSAGQTFGDGIGPRKNLFCGLPLFHVNGVLVTGLVPFSKGAHVLLGTPQGYRGDGVVKRFWEIVEHHGLHFFSGVPTLYASLLQIPVAGRRIGSLEYALCGAAPLPIAVMTDFAARTGATILEGYGLTEATCVSSVNPPRGERRAGSIGLRIPGQPMKVARLDANRVYQGEAEIDEIGVIAVCGPNVFEGYTSASQNEHLFIDCGDGGRWLDTGDLGKRDAEGYFWLTGRKKELIIRGGHNIDPAAVEEPLHRHPAVQLAAAVGRPDVHAGELPVAYVELRPGAKATEAELLAFAATEISERAALPKAIRILEKLPLTAVGKIYKPALKKLETEDAIKTALREAGVDFASVRWIDDATRGASLRVVLRDSSDGALEARARDVLGRFAFAFAFAFADETETEAEAAI